MKNISLSNLVPCFASFSTVLLFLWVMKAWRWQVVIKDYRLQFTNLLTQNNSKILFQHFYSTLLELNIMIENWILQ